MKAKQSTFTAENIVAILTAAPCGGNLDDVITRAKVEMSTASLQKWLKDGAKDAKELKNTAYRIFSDQWNAVYPGAPPRNEAARMLEIHKAMTSLGIECKAASNPPAPSHRSRKPADICDCGNAKLPNKESCDTCTSLDTTREQARAASRTE